MSRPATDRQFLHLHNAESATAWIMSFAAECHAEKKEDKVNTDGTVQDLQVTYLFPSMCGQDAIILPTLLWLPTLLEEARYCDFEKLKRAASPEEELVKI